MWKRHLIIYRLKIISIKFRKPPLFTTFKQTIISTNSPFDQYVKGNKSALTENQKIGALLFYGKAKCVDCHSGLMFSDWIFNALGTQKEFLLLNIKCKAQKFSFRTPTLRKVSIMEHKSP